LRRILLSVGATLLALVSVDASAQTQKLPGETLWRQAGAWQVLTRAPRNDCVLLRAYGGQRTLRAGMEEDAPRGFRLSLFDATWNFAAGQPHETVLIFEPGGRHGVQGRALGPAQLQWPLSHAAVDDFTAASRLRLQREGTALADLDLAGVDTAMQGWIACMKENAGTTPARPAAPKPPPRQAPLPSETNPLR